MRLVQSLAAVVVPVTLGLAIASYVATHPALNGRWERLDKIARQGDEPATSSVASAAPQVPMHDPQPLPSAHADQAETSFSEVQPVVWQTPAPRLAEQSMASLPLEVNAPGIPLDAGDDATGSHKEESTRTAIERVPPLPSAISAAIRALQAVSQPAESTFQPSPAAALEPAAAPAEPLPEPSKIGITHVDGEGDDRLSIHFKDEDIRAVLAAFSEQGGLNILPSKSVQGTVSASLSGVSVETALEAILRSTGYVARREGAFIYVGTPADFDAMAHVADTIGTRVYRPNYVTAQELVALITPLLSPAPLGKVVASSPSKVDIPSDDVKAGGNDLAAADAVLVQDYEAVLVAVDQIVAEIDRCPPQVAIEAMILSVRLNDTNRFGVDFQFLQEKQHLQLATGTPMTDLAQVTFNNGLKFAFLDSNLGAFLDALETIGDTNVIATPHLMVLNKQRAEILIGSELGYVSTSQTETSTTQSVNFLEVGAQLRLRPFISPDGIIRMEIHPELSNGSVRVEGGFTLPDKDVTKVTTNIMVRDGYTVVIGGLMREDLSTTTSQLPLVGNLPLIGPLFRNKNEEMEKREILVLVTPRIVREPGMYEEGEQAAGEFHRRQSVYRDKMSPLGRRSLGRKYFRLAQEAWERGDCNLALKQVSTSIEFDPLNRAAIDLRSDIWAGTHSGDHSGGGNAPPAPPDALPDESLSPWILDELEHGAPLSSQAPSATRPAPPARPARLRAAQLPRSSP